MSDVLFIVVSNFTQSVVESFEAAHSVNETHYSSAVILPGLEMFDLPIRYSSRGSFSSELLV